MSNIIELIISNLIEIVVAVILAVITTYLIPWLKKKNLYNVTMNLVTAAKEFGMNLDLDGEQKYNLVMEELRNLGIDTNNSYVIMTVKACVSELRDKTGST